MTKKIIYVLSFVLVLANVSFSQNTASQTKAQLVEQLFNQTSNIFPTQELSGMFHKLNTDKRGEMESGLKNALAVRIDKSALSSTQKTEIKGKIPNLIKDYSTLVNGIITKNFKIEKWVEESFSKHYSDSFSVEELKQLNDYFKTEEGLETIQLFNKTIATGMAAGDEEDDEEREVSDEDAAVMEKFLQTSFGTKFSEVLMDQIFADVMKEIDNWSDQFAQDFEKETESGSIKDLIEDFLSTNQVG